MLIQAPAKLNLYLHILGRRADGYHELETLVAFTTLADTLRVGPAKERSLEITGPFADVCGPLADNLVLRAARVLAEKTGTKKGAALTLEKHIPAGAGLGGGSSDAAATLRLLNDFWQLRLPVTELQTLAVALGADVAMCLAGRPLVARGIGEKILLLSSPLPPLSAVLVYPGKPLSTAQAYALLTPEPSLATPVLEGITSSAELFKALSPTRNQLQRAAIALLPEVAEALLALETSSTHAPFVRMAGSGSACYALLNDEDDAATLAGFIRTRHPDWWVMTTRLAR